MGVRMAVVMEMLMGMRMLVVMGMVVSMLMGMGVTVMGMLVGVGMRMVVAVAANVIVIEMHSNSSLGFFLSLYLWEGPVSKHLFGGKYPLPGLARRRKIRYNLLLSTKGGRPMSDHIHEHDHAYLHAHGIAHSHGHVHENQKAVINRLARAIGHLEKVKRMVEEGHDCSEVLIQLAAVRSALDNTGKVILKDHMRHCMVDAVAAGDEDAIDDLCQAIDKFMK